MIKIKDLLNILAIFLFIVFLSINFMPSTNTKHDEQEL
jgi:hypothetical protein